MGCTSSLIQSGSKRRKKKMTIPEVVVFVPTLWIPCQIDLQRTLKGLIPKDLIDRLSALRNRIILVAADTGSDHGFLMRSDGSATSELNAALDEYLSVFLGLTHKEAGLEESVEFKWRSLDDGRNTCVSNSWFELLCVIYMRAVLTLSEANLLLVPKESSSGSSQRTVPLDCQRDAIDMLLEAAGYLDFCLNNILARLAPNVKEKLPADLQEGVLQALSIQAIGQGTEIQLGLAVENQKATLSVKRRLACEELAFFSQAHLSLSGSVNNEDLKKHLMFIRWKFLEAKAASYYYHGLIVDKGSDPQCHINAVCCFVAADEILAESKKACLSFSLANPVTRPPPPWGIIKHLHLKVPEMASKKSQMYGYLLEQEKGLQAIPDLPEFQLSLRPEDYELPAIDPAWNKENWELPGEEDNHIQ